MGEQRDAEAARDESGGRIEAVTDEEILRAHRILSSREGIFVEPASAASVAGLLLTTEAMIAEAPQKNDAPAMPGGGGMGDMGGMGGMGGF